MNKWKDLQIIVLLGIVFASGIGIENLMAEEGELQEVPPGILVKEKREASQDIIELQALDVESLQEEVVVEAGAYRLESIGELEVSKKLQELQVLDEKPPQELELLGERLPQKEEVLVEKKTLELNEEIEVRLEEVAQPRQKKLKELQVLREKLPQELKLLKEAEVLKAEPVTKIKVPVRLDQSAIKQWKHEKRTWIKGGISPVKPVQQFKVKSGAIRPLKE